MQRRIGAIGLMLAVVLLSGCFTLVFPPDVPLIDLSPPELRNVVFAQVDWYESDGTAVQANSLYGLMSWTYDPDLTTTFYLNVTAALTLEDETSWVIQNLPLFGVDNNDAGSRREATYFNLAELGLVFDSALELVSGIDVSQLYVQVTVGSEILDEFPDLAADLVEVLAVEHWASGLPDESPEPGPFLDPGQPEGVKLNAKPEKVNVARDVRPVQEARATCCAGSFARSLDWLNRKYELGIERTAQQIYGDLISAGVSRPNGDRSPARDEWVARKDAYARARSGGRIVTKVWDRGTDVSPIPGVAEETGDFVEWLKREIQTEDVELAYFYPGNAHIVTVLEVYTKDGDTYIKYRDDERQANDAQGDTEVKHAKIYKKEGQYHFGSDRNTIYFAVSESVVAAPPGEGEPPCEGE